MNKWANRLPSIAMFFYNEVVHSIKQALPGFKKISNDFESIEGYGALRLI